MRKKRGFTLIELLLALSLIVAVAALMFSFFGQGLSLYTKETASAKEQANLRFVLSDITTRARLADVSTIKVTDGVLSIGSTTYSFDSAHQRVLRGDSALATGISAFSVTLNNSKLSIRVTSTGGAAVSTSFSLAE